MKGTRLKLWASVLTVLALALFATQYTWAEEAPTVAEETSVVVVEEPVSETVEVTVSETPLIVEEQVEDLGGTSEEVSTSEEDSVPPEEEFTTEENQTAPLEEQAQEAVETESASTETTTVSSGQVESATTETVQSPELTTDKADYAPSDIVTIWGKFFDGLKNIVLKIVGGVGSTYHEFVQFITTDENGEFTAVQPLDGVYRPEYTATAYDEEGNALASVDFTDAAVGGYDQCSNDDGDGYATGDTGCRWTNGNLQSNNSTYFEGDSTVQRLWLDGLMPGATHTITFQYGTTKQGKHAYDYLTTWNHSENWLTIEDRCQGITGCTTASETSRDIPQDPNVPDIGQPNGFEPIAPGSRQFVMRGGTLDSATTPTIVSGTYAGDSETAITVGFTVGPSSGSMCVTKQGTTTCSIAIWFGAHISVTDDWVPVDGGTGATTIPGSPYHVALSALDGGSVGNRDNQMQAGAIQANATIVIVKDAVPNGPQDFSFTTTGTGLSNFSLDDDEDNTLSNTQTFTGLTAGSYSVTEGATAGWDLTSIVCIDPTTNTNVNLGTRSANIDLAAGETVTCTFTNTLQTGNIVIVKDAVPNDPQNFTFNNDFGNSNPASFELDDDNDGTLPNSRSFEVLAGTYAVSESAISGWTQTSATCDDGSPINAIVVSPGETVTCTFVNTKKANIIVKKVMVGGTDTFEFTGNPSGSISVNNGTIQLEVTPGQYVSTESAKAGWDLNSVVCDDVNSTGNAGARTATFNAEAGETITCTFTNTKRGHLIVQKTTVPASDPTEFSILASGSGTITGVGTGTITDATDKDYEVTPGTYSVAETVPAGWDKTGDTCQNVVVNAGETKYCLITNTKRGTIVIEKQTLPDGDSATFSFSGDVSGSLSDGQTASQSVAPGTYSSVEANKQGWKLSSIVCDDAQSASASTGDVSTKTAIFRVEAGETVKCTFTNTKLSTLVLIKNTVGGNGTFNFTATGTGLSNAGLTTIGGTAQTSTSNLDPDNTYSYTETVPNGWDLTSSTCDQGETPDSINLEPGETVTCTFVNTKRGKIQGAKYNDVAGDGSITDDPKLSGWTFKLYDVSTNPWTLAGTTVTDVNGAYEFNNVVPGSYKVCEVLQSGWVNTYPTTGVSSNPDDTNELCRTTNIDPGDNATRNFGNYQIKALTVEKTANTSYTRTYNWDIKKSVTPETWNLFKGDSGTSEYTVTVTKTGYTDSAWKATGSISIHNPNAVTSLEANITSVTDALTGGVNATVSCPNGLPQLLGAGATLVCTYTTDLPDATNRTNTATVTTSGLVPGGQGTAQVTFGDPSNEVNASVNVDDTVQGDLGEFSDTDSVTYEKTFTCDSDKGEHDNIATIVETQQSDSASVTVNCYDLEVTKTVNTELDRNWTWTIDKTGDKTQLTLYPGQIYTVNYDVDVNASSKDSNWKVAGSITIQNNHPSKDADLTQVVDQLTVDGAAEVDCSGATAVPAAGNIVCTYAINASSAGNQTNTATATQQNYDYDKDGLPTASGTTDYSGNASVNFAGATVNESDECADFTDTLYGDLGVLCSGDVPQKFEYTHDVGPYTDQLCGTTQLVDNTASFITSDTGATGEDSWRVSVDVACVCSLTQGYWKTHNDSFKGGAPSDPNWSHIGSLKEKSGFFTTDNYPLTLNGPNTYGNASTGFTWFKVFNTAPKGNAYYNLAHQYMAAKLNRLNGAANATIDADLLAAENLFKAYTPAQIAALKNKSGDKALRQQFIDLAGKLGAFNEGLTNPAGHCTEPPAPVQ